MHIAECGGHEVLIQDFKTSIQLPNENDEAAEVIVVVDEHLSIRAADTNADCLRTKEGKYQLSFFVQLEKPKNSEFEF